MLKIIRSSDINCKWKNRVKNVMRIFFALALLVVMIALRGEYVQHVASWIFLCVSVAKLQYFFGFISWTWVYVSYDKVWVGTIRFVLIAKSVFFLAGYIFCFSLLNWNCTYFWSGCNSICLSIRCVDHQLHTFGLFLRSLVNFHQFVKRLKNVFVYLFFT